MIYASQSQHGENWRSLLEKLLRPVPLLGSGRHALAVSRLALALEALISAGVSIVEAWEIAAAASNLYHSGEISGKLDETLRRLHVFYQEEGTHKIQLVAQWVPRLIYFIIVLCIAYFVLQFYTGYFGQINQAINF